MAAFSNRLQRTSSNCRRLPNSTFIFHLIFFFDKISPLFFRHKNIFISEILKGKRGGRRWCRSFPTFCLFHTARLFPAIGFYFIHCIRSFFFLLSHQLVRRLHHSHSQFNNINNIQSNGFIFPIAGDGRTVADNRHPSHGQWPVLIEAYFRIETL